MTRVLTPDEPGDASIYTTHWCGYCVRAKSLLDAKDVAYEEVALDGDPSFRAKLLDLTGSGRCRRSSSTAARSAATASSSVWSARAASTGCSASKPRRARPGTRGSTRCPGRRRRSARSASRSRSHGSPRAAVDLELVLHAGRARRSAARSRSASSPAARSRARARGGSSRAASGPRPRRGCRPRAADACAHARAPRRRRCSRRLRRCAGRGSQP